MGQEPAGIRWLHVHPQYLVDEDARMIVKLAHLWREGVMPELGGPMDQAAATVASIEIVTRAWSQLEEARRKKD